MDDSNPPMNSHQADSTPMISGDHTDVYRLIADSTWDWELWLGPDGMVRYASPSCERISGYRQAAFLADPNMLAAIVHPEDRESFARHREQEKQDAGLLTHEYRIITRTGEERWLSHVCQAMHGDDGRLLGRRASNREITDRVRAEQAYHNLVDHSLQGFLIFQDGMVVFANAMAAEMTGFGNAELLHWHAEDMIHRIHPDDKALVWSRFQARVAGQTVPHHYGFRFIRKDGVIRHWEIFSTMLPYWGRPAVHVAILDVTERKAVEEEKDRVLSELRDSETRFRRRSTELEALHDVSLQLNTQPHTAKLLQLIIDQSVKLLDVEAGMLFLYDPESDQLCGEIATDYLTEFIGMKLDRGQGLAWQAFTNRRGMTISNYPGWANRVAVQQRRPLLTNLLAVPLLGASGVLGVLDLGSERRTFGEHDVWLAEMFAAQASAALENARLVAEVRRQAGEMTALANDNAHLLEVERQQFQRLQESQTQMVRVEKMAALGRMAAALAHEINNPLQAIQSHVELVMDFQLTPDQQADFLAVVRAEMERLTEIVQRVLDFSRPALALRQPVEIDDLIHRTLVLAGKQLQRHGIQVATAVEGGLAVAVGRDQMVQVFLNLVINAVEAIGNNGRIEIRADGQDGYARIAFANDGPCIPAEHLPHLFEPFYTTKPDGTGLGLAVSQNLVAQYGGEIAVANCIDGPGVVFTVHLPLVQAA